MTCFAKMVSDYDMDILAAMDLLVRRNAFGGQR
jgi:glutamine amidotransferase PdxT